MEFFYFRCGSYDMDTGHVICVAVKTNFGLKSGLKCVPGRNLSSSKAVPKDRNGSREPVGHPNRQKMMKCFRPAAARIPPLFKAAFSNLGLTVFSRVIR